jgi:Suppressor of fused protein (SUFU)
VPSRPGPGLPQPVTLLDSVSPYESRRVTVEYDGVVTAAYLNDATSAISAVWMANHEPAPQEPDRERLDAGRPPLMPAARTKHPGGRPPLEAGTLEALWFEEGDGVAILESGRAAAVIAGWADADRGMPGYSIDVIGQTPYGWSLDDAMDGLAPRLERATAFWRWRDSADGWSQFQRDVLEHLSARLGPGGYYWRGHPAGRRPLIGVTERPAGGRPYTVLSTVGMSCQRMPAVEQVLDDAGRYARIELAAATTLPSAQAARVFSWLAPYPWHDVTWFGPGHSVRWDDEPSAFPLGAGEAVLLLESPGALAGPQPPDLSGFTVAGDPVRWLWVVPILERHRQIAKDEGSGSLVSRLAEEQRSWITGPSPARR